MPKKLSLILQNLKIMDGTAELLLFQEDCQLLATALNEMDTDQLAEEAAQIVRAWSTAFQAMTVALSQSQQLSPKQVKEIFGEIEAKG